MVRTVGLTSFLSEVHPGILNVHLGSPAVVLVVGSRTFHLIFHTTLSGKGTVFQYSHETESHMEGHMESLTLTDPLTKSYGSLLSFRPGVFHRDTRPSPSWFEPWLFPFTLLMFWAFPVPQKHIDLLALCHPLIFQNKISHKQDFHEDWLMQKLFP